MAMKLQILAVGSLNEPFWRDAQAEYLKRLSRYLSVSVDEVSDLPVPERLSDAEKARVLDREGQALLGKIRPGTVYYCLDSHGRELSSEAWAEFVEARQREGANTALLIGGSLGISDAVKKGAKGLLSFGPMTLPHGLARVVLLEQVYRACRILRHEPYHK